MKLMHASWGGGPDRRHLLSSFRSGSRCAALRWAKANHRSAWQQCHRKQKAFSRSKNCHSKQLKVNLCRGSLNCRASGNSGDDDSQSSPAGKNGWTFLAGGVALLLAIAITFNQEDIADAIYDEGLRGTGDTLAAVLWSISLYFCSPWQTLLIFLGRVDTERPSDWLMSRLASAGGLDTNDRDLQYPVALRAATVVLFAMSGTAVALALSTALGDATWSLSTGLGSCLIAGIYEVGRPERLSAEEADQLDEQYKDFFEFAEERLQPRGSCHESEIFNAFRRSNAKYRTEDSLSDPTLRRFIRTWAKQYVYPTAERTGNGFFKRISLRERIDPFTGAGSGQASQSSVR